MRIIQLSDHPGDRLHAVQQQRQTVEEQALARYEQALAQHRASVAAARAMRDNARTQRRWLTWLRGAFAEWAEQGRAPNRPVAYHAPSDQEEILTAGMTGEQLVASELGRAFGDDWVLLRGYRNRGGEIDHLLLGPRGLFAMEVKHRNATVHVDGDTWRFDKYDRFGNLIEQGRITDRGGRSPSRQVNDPADELQQFLTRRRQQITIQRVVILTHPQSQLGSHTGRATERTASPSSGKETAPAKAPPDYHRLNTGSSMINGKRQAKAFPKRRFFLTTTAGSKTLMICIQCSYTIPKTLSTCPNCGRPAEGLPGAHGRYHGHFPARRGPFMDASRWTERDRITGVASAVLLISLFLPWFGVTILGMTVTADGLASHGYLRIVLILCLAILGYLILRISPVRSALPASRTHDRILLAATAVNLALVVIGFITTPGDTAWAPLVSHQYGSFTGGIAALAAVAPLGAAVFNITARWPGL